MPISLKSVYSRVQARVPGYRYGDVFALLLLTYVYMASVPPTGRWVPLGSVLLLGLTLLACVLASKGGPLVFYAATAVIIGGLAASILGLIGGYSDERAVAYAVGALLVLAAPVTIVRGIVVRGTIDNRTILAALSIYVLLGMLWAFIELTIQTVSSHPFFAQTGKGTTADFLYFSFVTLTTVGYGDLTAARSFGRSLAVLEAMLARCTS